MNLFQLDFPTRFIVTNLTPCLNSAVWQLSALVNGKVYYYLCCFTSHESIMI